MNGDILIDSSNLPSILFYKNMEENKNKEESIKQQKARLEEIAEIKFGILSDDEILRFLAERKRLVIAIADYEKEKQEEQERKEREAKMQALMEAKKKYSTLLQNIEELNQTISPDKADDELLSLISQRKTIEKELKTLDETFPELAEDSKKDSSLKVKTSETKKKKIESKKEKTPAEESLRVETIATPLPSPEIEDISSTEVPTSESHEKEKDVEEKEAEMKVEEKNSTSGGENVDEKIGDEKINLHNIEVGSEFNRYLDQLQVNAGSLGEFLQGLPVSARKNKAFMLKVAEMDPAYAMHYADSFTLKRDEDFNIRIASMKNPRNSGNALSEMLPEFRTSKVVLVAVKNDYRNVKFLQPTMKDYDEILTLAKKEALEKVKSLKDSADMNILIPKILQQDKLFMEEAEKAKTGSK